MNTTHLHNEAAKAFREIEDTLIQVADMFFDSDDPPHKDLMRCVSDCERMAEALDPPTTDPYQALRDAPTQPETNEDDEDHQTEDATETTPTPMGDDDLIRSVGTPIPVQGLPQDSALCSA